MTAYIRCNGESNCHCLHGKLSYLISNQHFRWSTSTFHELAEMWNMEVPDWQSTFLITLLEVLSNGRKVPYSTCMLSCQGIKVYNSSLHVLADISQIVRDTKLHSPDPNELEQFRDWLAIHIIHLSIYLDKYIIFYISLQRFHHELCILLYKDISPSHMWPLLDMHNW